jgi:hypothetical protein
MTMSATSSLMRTHQAALVDALHSALRESAFDNHFSLHPRRLEQIGARQAGLFVDFMDSAERSAVFEEGRELAREGLGEKTVLRVASLLLHFCMKQFASAPDLLAETVDKADGYSSALLEGFMKGREDHILQEQEKLHLAYAKATENRGT